MRGDRAVLKEALRTLRDHIPCLPGAFCDGSWANRVEHMHTCTKCWLEHDIRQHLKKKKRKKR